MVTSCVGQDQKLDRYQQQKQQLLGTWLGTGEAGQVFDSLVFRDNGHYHLSRADSMRQGKWHIEHIMHLFLDQLKYQFYFKGSNLVLTDEHGLKFEFSNPQFEDKLQSVLRSDSLISPFVRRIWHDQSGNLWLGTNGDGVVLKRPKQDDAIPKDGLLEYYSRSKGFAGVAVRGITEDKEGNVWFGTSGGISKFDPAAANAAEAISFTNLTEEHGLIDNDVWSIMIDRAGTLWIGTLQGVSCFDGKEFTTFELPETQPDTTRGVTSARIIHCIVEDRLGRIWFATNGGVFIHTPNSSEVLGVEDGSARTLLQITKQDGLCNDVVNCILEDQHGNLWFATHHNGICRLNIDPDNGTRPSQGPLAALGYSHFTHFTEEDGVQGLEAWDLYEDSEGNIWFPTEGYGVYRYSPPEQGVPNQTHSITNFYEEDGLLSGGIQSTHEDRQGNIWLGGWMGLFRFDPEAKTASGHLFTRMTKYAPW